MLLHAEESLEKEVWNRKSVQGGRLSSMYFATGGT